MLPYPCHSVYIKKLPSGLRISRAFLLPDRHLIDFAVDKLPADVFQDNNNDQFIAGSDLPGPVFSTYSGKPAFS